MTQPVDPIRIQPPVPSILTTARDRSGDGFGRPPAEPVAGMERAERAAWARGNGISWPEWTCSPTYPARQCQDDERETGELGGAITSAPFLIYTPLECAWAEGEPLLDDAARALTEARTAYRLARALWMGEGLPVAVPQLTLRDTATDLGIVGDLDDVVALLLQAYEDATQGLGGATLHIPSVMATGALGGLPGGGKVATLEGQVYRGPLGSLISFGPGYPSGASAEDDGGFGPLIADASPAAYEGNSADEVWVYVTGPVEYALTPITLADPPSGQALRMNLAWGVGERMGIFRFSPCTVFAARAFNTTTTSQTVETS